MMGYCAFNCDNVTTCDNVFFAGCHAVSRCFVGACDNVTTYIYHAHIQAHAHAPDANIRNMMSHCHNNKRINKLNRDNLQKEVVKGRHCDNLSEVWLCVGGLLTLITWFQTLVMRSVGRAGRALCNIRHGLLMMCVFRAMTGVSRACWGFATARGRRLGFVMLMPVSPADGFFGFGQLHKKAVGMQDWDWLDYLTLLNPKGTLSGGGHGGVSRVSREDVLAALSGINAVAELLVYARLNMLSSDDLAAKSFGSAFVSALVMFEGVVADYSPNDFFVVWREVCRDDAFGHTCQHCNQGRAGVSVCTRCNGYGVVDRSDRSMSQSARVSRDRWLRLKPLLPICKAVISARWDDVRRALSANLSNRHLSMREAA